MSPLRPAHDPATVGRLLALVDARDGLTQRALADELGVALGRVNAYLRRCADDGLVAVTVARGGRRRYALTAKGAAEKNRLGTRYLSDELALFRHARDSFDRLYDALAARGLEAVVLCGIDELTEIALLCSLGARVRPVGVWRHAGRPRGLRGVPGVTLGEAAGADAVVLSVGRNVPYVYHALGRRLPRERIAVPDVLDVGAALPDEG